MRQVQDKRRLETIQGFEYTEGQYDDIFFLITILEFDSLYSIKLQL